jgi:hypothetical protein
MAALAGGRPITSGKNSSTRNAMPDPSAENFVSSARAMPNFINVEAAYNAALEAGGDSRPLVG